MASVNGLSISIKGSLDDSLYISAIIAEDGLSQVPMIQVELATKDTNIGLKDFLGEHYQLEVGEGDSFREFSGYCTEAEYLGTQSNWALYGLTLHPFMWFLTKTKNSRVFQGLKIEEIFDKILKDHGFDHDLDVQLGDPTLKRDYCVQYRETDFDFISRLMEEEGVFYHFDFKGGQGKMVLSNASSRLPDFDGISKLEYAAAAQGQADPYQQLYKWSSEQRVVTGKVSLNDYDFERPKAKLETATEIAQGSHKFNKIESYDYQSHIPSGGDGKNLTRVSVQSHAALAATWRGETDLCHVTVGKMFSVVDHPQTDENDMFLCIKSRHVFVSTDDGGEFQADKSLLLEKNGIDALNGLNCKVEFTAIPKEEEFSPPQTTHWPEISGVQTAMVKGPSGDEIHTDEYGRIKIKFHWDREGKDDGTSSCYVRCMMPWTGKNWGMINIPRIGQEVVVQFEDGNPDRPIVVGMLYNADTKPPYPLPAEATKSGIKTNSSKGGGGFNELMFEDKKDKELVRFQSEKDFEQIIKNNAKVTVGLEKKDPGKMDLTVHGDLTEAVKTGNHKFDVDQGNQTIFVKKNLDEKVDGNSTQTVFGDVKQIVTKGNYLQDIKIGNYSQQVGVGKHETNVAVGKMNLTVGAGMFSTKVMAGHMSTLVGVGNMSTTVGAGNMSTTVAAGRCATTVPVGMYSVSAWAGGITLSSMKNIKLKVGPSSIELTPAGITISGPMVNIKAKGKAAIKAPLTQVNGDALLLLKGSLTKIN